MLFSLGIFLLTENTCFLPLCIMEKLDQAKIASNNGLLYFSSQLQEHPETDVSGQEKPTL